MAGIGGNQCQLYDTPGVKEMTFEELVLTNPLPQRAKVTAGYEDPYNPDYSFSTGDVIEVRRLIACNVPNLPTEICYSKPEVDNTGQAGRKEFSLVGPAA